MGRLTWITGLVLCVGLSDGQTASGQPVTDVMAMDRAEVPHDILQRSQHVAGTARAAQTQPAAPAAPGQAQPTIVLHVMNYAALSSDVLNETMARVARVYNVIGVRTVWVEGERSADQRQNSPLHLSILLLSRDMAEKKISLEGLKDGVFGQAHQPSGRASIFCERIASMPGAPTYVPIPLGDVIAHEVGHLVLGKNNHSRSGIMRAYTNVHTMHLQTFEEAQARTIRMVLTKLASTTAR